MSEQCSDVNSPIKNWKDLLLNMRFSGGHFPCLMSDFIPHASSIPWVILGRQRTLRPRHDSFSYMHMHWWLLLHFVIPSSYSLSYISLMFENRKKCEIESDTCGTEARRYPGVVILYATHSPNLGGRTETWDNQFKITQMGDMARTISL